LVELNLVSSVFAPHISTHSVGAIAIGNHQGFMLWPNF
jgi:hypothetical protein